jgi:hypothetical protein
MPVVFPLTTVFTDGAIHYAAEHYELRDAINELYTSVTDAQNDATQALGEIAALLEPIYHLSYFRAGAMTSARVLLIHTFSVPVTFPGNMSGAYGSNSVAPVDATYTFDVQKNGASVGTIVMTNANNAATFTTTGGNPVAFAAGDVMKVVAPTPVGAHPEDVAFTLPGVRV